MSEEEIIEIVKYQIKIVDKKGFCYIGKKALQGLLDLCNKQKEEIKELNKEFALNTEIHKRDEEIKELKETIKCLHEPAEKYISKDKIEKELLEPINKERQETYKDFMKKGKDDYHGVEGSVLQELNWVVGTIEELLGE